MSYRKNSGRTYKRGDFLALAPKSAGILLSVAVLLMLVVVSGMLPVLHTSLQIIAMGLAFAAIGLLAWRMAEKLRSRKLSILVLDLVADDPDVYLICRSDMVAIMRNHVAKERFGTSHPAEIISEFVASPETVLAQLYTECQSDRIAYFETNTSDRSVLISMRHVGSDLYLWRLSEQAINNREVLGGGKFLRVKVSAEGEVISITPALRALLGHQVKHIDDIAPQAQLVDRAIVSVDTPSGDEALAVHCIGGEKGALNYGFTPIDLAELQAGSVAEWDVLESLPVPLLQLSLTGEITACNRSARNLLRREVGPGAQLADYLDGLGRPVRDWIDEAYSQDSRGVRSQFLRGTGENRDLFVQVALCPSISGKKSQTIAVLHDVTEFKLLEAQFVQSQKMQGIGQLAGGIAHDFNNLITAINGHCELLLLRHDVHDPDYGDLTQIHQNTSRAAALVRQLLAFSRKQDMQMELVDLRDTLADLTHLLNRLVGERVRLILRHYPQRLFFTADKRQFEQVILNLVVNARDAMEDGGQVTIETEMQRFDQALQRDRATVPAGDYVVIKVRDQGRGIAPELVNQIFEPFYTTKKSGEGTGLGLSTVYGIVKQTGGFIFVNSVVGGGAEFSIFFPARQASDEVVEVVPKSEKASDKRGAGVILLVEDEAPVRAFASRALKLRGYDVLEADCGEAALELLQEQDVNIDLVVSDVVMPGMDGPSWVSEALQTRPGMRIVFMSGYSEEGMRKHRERIPGSVFLPKPFTLDSLLSTVQEQMG